MLDTVYQEFHCQVFKLLLGWVVLKICVVFTFKNQIPYFQSVEIDELSLFAQNNVSAFLDLDFSKGTWLRRGLFKEGFFLFCSLFLLVLGHGVEKSGFFWTWGLVFRVFIGRNIYHLIVCQSLAVSCVKRLSSSGWTLYLFLEDNVPCGLLWLHLHFFFNTILFTQ